MRCCGTFWKDAMLELTARLVARDVLRDDFDRRAGRLVYQQRKSTFNSGSPSPAAGLESG